jgi:hypothetical protein
MGSDMEAMVLRITGRPMAEWLERYNDRLIEHIVSGRISPYRWYLPADQPKFSTLYALDVDDIVYGLVPVEVIRTTYPQYKPPIGRNPEGVVGPALNVLAFRLNPARFGDIRIAA